MAIKITRNESGNCINFVGSTNPAYWNACLSATVNSGNANGVNVVNDIISQNSTDIVYEFHNVDFSEFADRDGNSFSDAQEVVNYINAQANVSGVGESGVDLSNVDVNFRLDQTSTTILLDDGQSFAVNSIKAVVDVDGTIHVKPIQTGVPNNGQETSKTLINSLMDGHVYIEGALVSGGVQTVANTLNELFTVGPFESVVISDPYSTMVADVSGVEASGALVGQAVNPSNSDIGAGVAAHYNQSGWMSSDTIDQAGEYFTFDIRNEGIIGMGLVPDDASDAIGNASYGDPANFCQNGNNSGHWGFQFGHFFHPSPNGPWTNYGANTKMVYGPGWSTLATRFMSSPEGADWLAGDPVKMRVGLDANGFISVSYYDSSESDWIVITRTSYPTLEGVEYRLGIKFCDSLSRLASAPKVHLLEAAAPTMQFRYIESPDNNFEYPLFATEDEAEFYDLNHDGTTGTGTAHTHTYTDDPTGTTWYMPDTGGEMAGTAAPTGQTFMSNPVTYTEITSLTNSDLTPSPFTGSDFTYQEGTSVNLQLLPAGASWTQTVSIDVAGSGLVYNSVTGYLQGTLSDVPSDTVYTVTVTRANSYGSSNGTFTVTSTNVAPVSSMLTDWNKALDFSGSNEYAKLVSNHHLNSALRMQSMGVSAGAPATSGNTSNHSNARPWATAIVFRFDGNNSNQHIWNSGEGSNSSNDNIYLRIDASGDLYFGWGRGGNNNECYVRGLGTGYQTGNWHGVYIASTGERLSAGNATSSNLANCFDIRYMASNYGNFATLTNNISTSGNWTSGGTGVSMTNTVMGDFTIGGRGGNRNFHGKVASMVVTTLKNNQLMPVDAEIIKMITDPAGWVTDYKLGQTFKSTSQSSGGTMLFPSSVPTADYSATRSTQVWLMGDGTSDSYANGMRNYINPSDQNNTKLQLNSMVSNDIQNVTIPGLT